MKKRTFEDFHLPWAWQLPKTQKVFDEMDGGINCNFLMFYNDVSTLKRPTGLNEVSIGQTKEDHKHLEELLNTRDHGHSYSFTVYAASHLRDSPAYCQWRISPITWEGGYSPFVLLYVQHILQRHQQVESKRSHESKHVSLTRC